MFKDYNDYFFSIKYQVVSKKILVVGCCLFGLKFFIVINSYVPSAVIYCYLLFIGSVTTHNYK